MNAFELTMMLAKLHDNLTATSIIKIYKMVSNQLFEGTLFPMDTRSMELLLDILHLCGTKARYIPWTITMINHRLQKELQDLNECF